MTRIQIDAIYHLADNPGFATDRVLLPEEVVLVDAGLVQVTHISDPRAYWPTREGLRAVGVPVH